MKSLNVKLVLLLAILIAAGFFAWSKNHSEESKENPNNSSIQENGENRTESYSGILKSAVAKRTPNGMEMDIEFMLDDQGLSMLSGKANKETQFLKYRKDKNGEMHQVVEFSSSDLTQGDKIVVYTNENITKPGFNISKIEVYE